MEYEPIFQYGDIVRRNSTSEEFEIINRIKLNDNWLFLVFDSARNEEVWIKEQDLFEDYSNYSFVAHIVDVRKFDVEYQVRIGAIKVKPVINT